MGSIIPPIEIYLDMLLAELIAQSATKILSNLAGLSLRPDPNDRSKSEVVWFVTNWTKDLQDAIDGFETKPTRKKRGRSPTTVIQTGPLRPVPHPGRRKRIGWGATVAIEGRATEGTVGGLLAADPQGARYLLTCRHVLDGRIGDNVVMLRPDGSEPLVAKLTRISDWTLGLKPSQPNSTDFAIAELNQKVSGKPAGPIPIAPQPAGNIVRLPIVPWRNLKLKGVQVRPAPISFVQFPYGQFTMSGMWLLWSTDPQVHLAEHGDSGSLFVFRTGEKLIPAAIAVGVSTEYTEVTNGTLAKTKGPPAVLACPVINIFKELKIPGLKFC